MDDLDQREAFLKAIFAAPDDDLPRLVFADWLDERGESAWAEVIRAGCEIDRRMRAAEPVPDDLAHRSADATEKLLLHLWDAGDESPLSLSRGFPAFPTVDVDANTISDPQQFRQLAVRKHPEWYGATTLRVTGGMIASSKPISTILNSPVTQQVTHLDLSGAVHTEETEVEGVPLGYYPMSEFTYRPTVTLQAVEALVSARECRRVTHLDLRNNDLDNDAARAIVRSTNLTRLKSLHLFDGNRLRGRTWQQLLDKFGEEVVQ